MPIYEYQCQACGGVNEVMQKFDAAAPDECEKCHKGPLTKLISKTAFVLKGNGWYVTDFRGGGDKKAAPVKSEGGSGGGEAKSAEAKPAADASKSSESSGSSGSSGTSSAAPAS